MFAKLATVAVVAALSVSPPYQQDDVAALRREIETLKAQQASMKKDLDAIKSFLQQLLRQSAEESMVNKTVSVTSEPSRGSAAAKVTLVEVSDYHCPFCRRHSQTTQPQIDSSYIATGKVRYVFIDYPIDQLHPNAYKAHEAANCAGDQGKYWDMHARLFANAPPVDSAQLMPLLFSQAQSVGVDAAKFRSCFEGGKYAKTVSDSVKRMQELGVDSTPTFLIGVTPQPGQPMTIVKVIKGALPFADFKAAIDPLLQ
jgi:protein-disulfide isomerase